MKKIICVIFALIVLSSCAPSAEMIQTAIAQTQLALVTPTLEKTTTPTKIPTFTPLPTLIPELITGTSVAKALTQTSLYSTQVVKNTQFFQTRVAFYPTQTQIAKDSIRTATAAWATQMASYKTIYRKELVNYPNDHKGENLKVSGRVFQIVNNSEFQIYIESSYDNLYVVTRDSYKGLYEDDYVTVYGTSDGEYCYKNMQDNTVCAPILINAFFIKQ